MYRFIDKNHVLSFVVYTVIGDIWDGEENSINSCKLFPIGWRTPLRWGSSKHLKMHINFQLISMTNPVRDIDFVGNDRANLRLHAGCGFSHEWLRQLKWNLAFCKHSRLWYKIKPTFVAGRLPCIKEVWACYRDGLDANRNRTRLLIQAAMWYHIFGSVCLLAHTCEDEPRSLLQILRHTWHGFIFTQEGCCSQICVKFFNDNGLEPPDSMVLVSRDWYDHLLIEGDSPASMALCIHQRPLEYMSMPGLALEQSQELSWRSNWIPDSQHDHLIGRGSICPRQGSNSVTPRNRHPTNQAIWRGLEILTHHMAWWLFQVVGIITC